MTLEELAGQTLWCGWGDAGEPDPKGYNEHARALVEELGVGGVVLFTRNLGEPAEIASLVTELRAHSRQPLLVGIDQEGGRVARLSRPGLLFPGAMALGTRNDVDLTHAVHRAIGEQLAAVGIDVDFAPVLDVNNNPANPIIGARSFGEEPERVSRHGIAALEGLRAAGVLPVVKHFPGHGDTGRDSHLELPVQPAEWERLDAVELAPFRGALAAGAPAVMSTHILFPALDAELPATLSPRILTGLLRERLGFEGLVITDCLEMRGIADHWGPEAAAVLALLAGADALLVCHTLDTQRRMRDAVCEAVRSGRLPEARLREAVRRLDRVRELTRRVREPPLEPERVGWDAYVKLERRCARECLAEWSPGEAKDRRPFSPERTLSVVGSSGPVERMAEALRRYGFLAEPRSRATEPGRWDANTQILLLDDSAPGSSEPVTSKSRQVLAAGAWRSVYLGVGDPYAASRVATERVRAVSWGGLSLHMEAVASWLREGAEQGRLPELLPVGRTNHPLDA